MKRLVLALLLAAGCAPLHASITIDLNAGQLLTAAGAPLPNGSLIQLVASTDNMFAAPSATSFTAGATDDTVLSSFALNSATGGSPGSFEQVIKLTLSGSVASGDELLLRWYPTLTTASTAPGSGTSYGQFRTDAVVDNSNIAWTIPGDGATDALVMATSSYGGSQPDSAGVANQTTATGVTRPAQPQITSAATSAAERGQPFSYDIVASNTPAAYGASDLPAGLSVNGSTGLISGVPTQAGVFNITLSASNAGGTGTATLALTVTAPPAPFPEITSAAAAEGVAGEAFTYQIAATNGPTSFGASGLPEGLAVEATTGLISGSPAVDGVFNVGLSATDAGGTGTAVLTLTVKGTGVLPPPAVNPPVVTSVLAANAQASKLFEYQITAENQPASFAVSGLPAGLDVDAQTGLISGKPAAPGVYSLVLGAVNASGKGTADLQLKVAAAPLPVVTVAATIAKVMLGTGASGEFTLKLSKALPKALVISYALKGSAIDGTDYHLLVGTKKILAGKTEATIKIVPLGDLDGAPSKVVSLILESGKGYLIGTTAPKKITILR